MKLENGVTSKSKGSFGGIASKGLQSENLLRIEEGKPLQQNFSAMTAPGAKNTVITPSTPFTPGLSNDFTYHDASSNQASEGRPSNFTNNILD